MITKTKVVCDECLQCNILMQSSCLKFRFLHVLIILCCKGFTPDVKVWEVCFDKSGSFKEVIRAFELKGHTAGVHSFSFSNDSRR